MSSTMLAASETDFPKSRIRRKPLSTYKSPAANDIDPLISFTRCDISSPATKSSSIQKKTSRSNRNGPTSRRMLRSRNHELPLYHPQGELALSLPPLNPADYGLPLPRLRDDTSQMTSSSSRGAPLKVPEADGDEDHSVPTVSSIAAVAANEVKRASPRKRRVGVGNGKRRRREIDDGDATYPAKRARQMRGGGDDNDFDDVQGDGDGTPELDGLADRRPERRSTRSRTKRRDSSEIESVGEQPVGDSGSVVEENTKQSVPEAISEGASEGKGGEIIGD